MGHDDTTQVGGVLASIGIATQVPLVEHVGVDPEQALHASPPEPHVPVDMPPTH